jgi:hypothetical protein
MHRFPVTIGAGAFLPVALVQASRMAQGFQMESSGGASGFQLIDGE